jgi:3-isopropylmalate dehydrogenase
MGTNTANPTSLLLSAAMMLNWLGRSKQDKRAMDASRALYAAVETCLSDGEVTRDLGGTLGTMEMGRAVIKRIGMVYAK